jgi:hypothetical protein
MRRRIKNIGQRYLLDGIEKTKVHQFSRLFRSDVT